VGINGHNYGHFLEVSALAERGGLIEKRVLKGHGDPEREN